MTENNGSTPSFDGTRYTGRVKWFNNRAGFGFVMHKEKNPDKHITI